MELEQIRKPKSYQNGKIYCIRSFQTDLIYIGSTTQLLSKRFSLHKRNYNCWKNNKANYITSFELLKYDDCYIELLEDYSCNSNNELQRREGQLIREIEKVVNKFIPGRTNAEYKFDNRDKIRKKIQCECGGHHLYNHTARHLKTNKHKKYIDKQSKDNI
jgi:hypothetical protein